MLPDALRTGGRRSGSSPGSAASIGAPASGAGRAPARGRRPFTPAAVRGTATGESVSVSRSGGGDTGSLNRNLLPLRIGNIVRPIDPGCGVALRLTAALPRYRYGPRGPFLASLPRVLPLLHAVLSDLVSSDKSA